MKQIIFYSCVLFFMFVFGFNIGVNKTEAEWTKAREQLLIQQIQRLQKKDHEIIQLKKSISVLNDSANRVRERDATIQRRLQTELRNCSQFRRALELSSATLARCAEHAVRDREIIERCAIQLR